MQFKYLLVILFVAIIHAFVFAQITVTEVVDPVLNEFEINGVGLDIDGETILFGDDRIITYTNEVTDDFTCDLCYDILAVVSYKDTQYISNNFGGIIKRFGDSLELIAGYDAGELVVDKNGILYGNDYGNGFFRWDGATSENWNEANSNIPTDWVYDLAVDSNGLVWLATQSGLVSFNGSAFSLKSVPGELSATFYNIVVDDNNAVWVASAYGGVGRFANNSWTTFPQTFNIFQLVQNLGLLHGNEIFTASFDNGLYRFYNNQFVNYSPEDLGYSELGNNKFIFGDAQGRLWMKFANTPLIYLTTGITAVNHIQSGSELSIYPNPATAMTYFSLPPDRPGIMAVHLFTMEGKSCFRSSFNGSEEVMVSLAGFAPGLYVAVVLDANGHQMIEKVMVR